MSLLLEAISKPALLIKLRLSLVTHVDELGKYITSNQLGQVFVQNLFQDFQQAKGNARADPVLYYRQYSN